jgi:hypothetical protein
MHELVDVGLPVELLTYLEPLELLVVGVNVQVNHVFKSLFISLGHACLFVGESSKLKNAVEEDIGVVDDSNRFWSVRVLVGDLLTSSMF